MRRADITNVYMFDTKIENIVINEHLIFASAENIKVYLVGLMYADLNKDINNLEIAKTVGITEKEVEEAWEYWQKSGIVELVDKEVIFKNIREEFACQLSDSSQEKSESKNSNAKKTASQNHPLVNRDLREMYSSIERIAQKPIPYKMLDRLRSLVDEVDIDVDLIIFAHEHGMKKGISNIYDFAYNSLMKWLEKGIKTKKDALEFLKNADAHYHVYRKVMGYLGFKRLATQGEMDIMDSWIERGISVEEMLEACKKTTGISSPNLNYVNKVLMNSLKDRTGVDEEGKVTRSKLNEYMQYLRDKAQEDRDRLVENIERKFPHLAKLGDDLRSLNMSLVQETIRGGNTYKLKDEVERKQREMNQLLHQNNIPPDYMAIKYKCPICKDFGTKEDGSLCSCMKLREEEAKKWVKV